MSIKQISVFLPNKPGILAKFSKLLLENDINMRAMTVAETADKGLLRMGNDKWEWIQIHYYFRTCYLRIEFSWRLSKT